MLLGNVYSVDVNAIPEESLVLSDLDVVTTHLPLPVPAVFSERPVFETVTTAYTL